MDASDIWEALNEEKRKRHTQWKQTNLARLAKSGLVYKLAGEETVIFREEGKPKVDFYPSTGRWRIAGDTRVYRGGAGSFIKWYNKR